MNIDIILFRSNRMDNDPFLTEVDKMLRAAEKQGHYARCLSSVDFSLLFDESGIKLKHRGDDYKTPDVVIAWVGLLAAVAERTMILKQLAKQGVPVLNGFKAVNRSKDKLRTMERLKSHGFPVIKSVLVSNLENLDYFLDDLGGFPIVAKTAHGCEGRGVSILESKRSLISSLELILSNNILCESIIIQEFIKEANEDYRLFIVGGKCVAQMSRKAPVDDFRTNIEGGGAGQICNLPAEVVKLAEDATKLLGLDISGVDIIMSADGPLICEINSKPGFKIIDITGVNVAEEILKFAEQKAILMNPKAD